MELSVVNWSEVEWSVVKCSEVASSRACCLSGKCSSPVVFRPCSDVHTIHTQSQLQPESGIDGWFFALHNIYHTHHTLTVASSMYYKFKKSISVL